jgi:hypothetical protein
MRGKRRNVIKLNITILIMRLCHKKLLLVLLLMALTLVFLRVPSSQTTTPQTTGTTSTVDLSNVNCVITNSKMDLGTCIYGYAMPLAFIGVLLSLVLVGVCFVIGEVIRLEGFKGWYKTELWETIKSVILILSIFFIIATIGTVATNLAGSYQQTGSCNFTVNTNAQERFETSLQGLYQTVFCSYIQPEMNQATMAFTNLLWYTEGLDILKSITVTSSVTFGTPQIPVLPGVTIDISMTNGGTYPILKTDLLNTIDLLAYSVVYQTMNYVINPIATLFTVLYTEFPFIIEAGLAIFIPLGMIMRAIPFLRPLGATLIALGLGIAVVYPSILLLFNLPVSNYMYATLGLPVLSQQVTQPANQIQQIPANVPSQISSILNTVTTSSAFSWLKTLLTTQASLSIGLFTPLVSYYPSINFLLTTELNPLVQLLLNVFDIIIFVVITSDIAKLLGGSLSFGIGQIRLV